MQMEMYAPHVMTIAVSALEQPTNNALLAGTDFSINHSSQILATFPVSMDPMKFQRTILVAIARVHARHVSESPHLNVLLVMLLTSCKETLLLPVSLHVQMAFGEIRHFSNVFHVTKPVPFVLMDPM